MTISFEIPELRFTTCAFSPDGNFFVVGGDSIRIYDWNSKRQIQRLRPTQRQRATGTVSIPAEAFAKYMDVVGFPKFTQQVAFSPVDRDLFASADADGAIRIWRISHSLPVLVIAGDFQYVPQLLFSPDGRHIICLSNKNNKRGRVLGEISVWNVADGSLKAKRLFYNDLARAICFNADGSEVAVSRYSNSKDRNSRIEFYQFGDWRLKRSVELLNGGGNSILLIRDLNRMVIAGGECVPAGNGCTPTGRIWVAGLDAVGPIQPLADVEGGYFNNAQAIGNGQKFLVRSDGIRKNGKIGNQIQTRDCCDGALLFCSDSDVDTFMQMSLNHREDKFVLLAPNAIHIVHLSDPAKTTAMQFE